jgi:Zn-dependent peptidase ImmA (M78 family)
MQTYAPFNRRQLTLKAASQAMKVRRRLGIGFHEPLSPFDVAEKLNVDVRFQNVPSMEGMYCQMQNRPPLIVLASERPMARQNFTCAHEIGHHEFGHGTHLDEFLDEESLKSLAKTQVRNPNDPNEFLADRFASLLLMPQSAVDRAFAKRGFTMSAAGPEEIYIVACYLGVGYSTLVEHLCQTLGRISFDQAQELRPWATRLPRLRSRLTGRSVRHVVTVDDSWEHSSVDLVTDDVLLVPGGWGFKGDGLISMGLTGSGAWQPGSLIQAARQGLATILTSNNRELSVRVSKRGFAGLAKYRHWDDPDDDLEEEEKNEI